MIEVPLVHFLLAYPVHKIRVPYYILKGKVRPSYPVHRKNSLTFTWLNWEGRDPLAYRSSELITVVSIRSDISGRQTRTEAAQELALKLV